ncbi:MAG: hypothetical protein IJJ45_07870 [Clostridia bacterium]|nr:hypothetical protein [Clostridia bacterium]
MKSVLIGFGVLGQYIVPCFERLMGADMADDLVAVKATDRDLEMLQAGYPFRIQVGGTTDVLNRLAPDVIVLAVKPPQIEQVLNEDIRPYFERLRERGRMLPDVYSFASTPRVERYADVLGSGVNAVCMIPSMQREVGGYDTAPIGVSFMAFDPAGEWPAIHRDRAKRFLEETGCVLTLPPAQMPLYIALNCACHVMYEFCFILQDELAARGMEAHLSQVAQTLRQALHRRFIDIVADIVPSGDCIGDARVTAAAAAMLENWHAGIMAYALENGAEEAAAHRHVCGSMELFLIEAQLGTRTILEENTRRHATPGGFTERAVRSFARIGTAPCKACIKACMDGGDTRSVQNALYTAAGRCAKETAGDALSDIG